VKRDVHQCVIVHDCVGVPLSLDSILADSVGLTKSATHKVYELML
jgi:hypothetical protein